ncbi:hypothetical protein TCAL_10311 [Tigriopus californicus]|uniref:CHK kinase-like domain-containing protein n=1 Tax=Tigriopus californicus TaxID=6832 RepID=A0A553NZM0_TIGCA|nr:hypothetical protein TCAL_10311 [Tigriopus californicus]
MQHFIGHLYCACLSNMNPQDQDRAKAEEEDDQDQEDQQDEQEVREQEDSLRVKEAGPTSPDMDGCQQRGRLPRMAINNFTKEWVLFIMQQYYKSNFQESLKEIGKFTAECAADKPPSSTGFDSNENQTEVSQHILSQAFKVMVDVPDPPMSGGRESDDTKGSGPNHATAPKVSGKEKGKERDNQMIKKKKNKIHHLFVKIPPKRTAKFERMVRRNRTLEHEVLVYAEFLKDLKNFVEARVGDNVTLKIPELYHGYQASDCEGSVPDNHVLIIEDLTKKGFKTRDWFTHKLTHEEVTLAVSELAKFHACGLAYRMSLKEEIDEKYPYLEDDLYTSNMAKELLAKYLDSYLHFLSLLPGIQEHVLKLRKISNEVFQLLVKLRRPSDPLGTRFNTVCHGDMWMGNLMFKSQPEESEDGGGPPRDKVSDCIIIDFHSAQFLSPATDLAHLLLTSTSREYRLEHWDEVIEGYYDTFNRTLAEFGLILRHLGTTYNDFLYEVKRALRGQFLCVAFIIPIVIYCGPTEWRFERRRGSSSDRKNTIRHLIQMMAIHEEVPDSPDVEEEAPDFEAEMKGIPNEFKDLYRDEELIQILIDLIHTAADLDILDFQEFCKHLDTPKPMWSKTQATTGKHKPVY